MDKRKEKIEIEKIDDEFNGITYFKGKRYVVSKVIPKEKVLIEERRIDGNNVVCKLDSVIEKSDKRVEPNCKYFNECGGCNLLQYSYDDQLNLKTMLIQKKFNEINYTKVEKCVGVGLKDYRNKTHIVFARYGQELRAGFFNEETHGVVDIPECMCHGLWYLLLRKAVLNWVKEYNVSIYSPQTQIGTLRFAVGRYYKKKLMLTLVVTKMPNARMNSLYNELLKDFKEVSLYVNINNKPTNEVLAGDFKYIAGNKYLTGQFCNIDFSLSPDSFFQINSILAERIYRDILKKVNTCDSNKVIDLFSGIGITSVLFAKNNKKVESIEIVKSAVDDAIHLAKKNNVINQITFNCGDCEKLLPKIKDLNKAVLFVDPPRRGLGKNVCRMISKASPQNIIYLSCNEGSLVEDLKLLMESGYIIESVKPYDMFAGTKHVETLVCLVRK